MQLPADHKHDAVMELDNSLFDEITWIEPGWKSSLLLVPYTAASEKRCILVVTQLLYLRTRGLTLGQIFVAVLVPNA